jgi:LPS sulfotransferase NodH
MPRILVVSPLIEEVTMPPRSSYLVCATPRSGSTLLCEALNNTELAGHPREYFEALRGSGLPRRPKEYFTDLDDPGLLDLLGDYSTLDTLPKRFAHGQEYARYLSQVLEEGTTPNGVFGAKVMWGYLDDFVGNLRGIAAYRDLPVPELLSTVFPDLRYLFVTRRDKLRQAVSLWKAIQSSTWSQEEPSSPQATHELVFHFEAIAHLLRRNEAHEEAWRRYFSENAIQPFHVVYEEFVASYEPMALDILHHLEIEIPEPIVFKQRRMKRQADALSEDWVQRFHSLKQADGISSVSERAAPPARGSCAIPE